MKTEIRDGRGKNDGIEDSELEIQE